MTAESIFEFLQSEIHTVVAATADENGLPVTCAIDIMDSDESGLYFLTAEGKNFYKRLKNSRYIALTGIKGSSTMTRKAVSVSGRVKEMPRETLLNLIEKNPYMKEIYPTEESRKALTAFKLFSGTGEWFDLSKKPIERITFSFGDTLNHTDGYYITEKCTGCGSCKTVCPQNCIDLSSIPAGIRQNNCLRCGNCIKACPKQAIEKRG